MPTTTNAMRRLLFCQALLLLCVPPAAPSSSPKQPRVAVVGAGISGAAAAHWLRLQGVEEITVFEVCAAALE